MAGILLALMTWLMMVGFVVGMAAIFKKTDEAFAFFERREPAVDAASADESGESTLYLFGQAQPYPLLPPRLDHSAPGRARSRPAEGLCMILKHLDEQLDWEGREACD